MALAYRPLTKDPHIMSPSHTILRIALSHIVTALEDNAVGGDPTASVGLAMKELAEVYGRTAPAGFDALLLDDIRRLMYEGSQARVASGLSPASGSGSAEGRWV